MNHNGSYVELIKMIDKKKLLDSLGELTKGINVDWDRLSYCDQYIQIFGWIDRSDKRRDFLIYLNVFDYSPELGDMEIFITSSAKYSEKFSENWGIGHSPCIKFKDFFNGVKLNPNLEDQSEYLSYDEAIKLLPDKDKIHIERDIPGLAQLGCNWDRNDILNTMKKFENTLQISGPNAQKCGHGLALIDASGPLFIETKKEKPEAGLTTKEISDRKMRLKKKTE